MDDDGLERDLLMIMFRLKRQREMQIREVERWYEKIRQEFDAEHPGQGPASWDRQWFDQVVETRKAEVIAEIRARAKYK